MIQLTITLDEKTGNLQVTGPIQDRILCYGMLELAKATIQEQAAVKPSIVPVHAQLPPRQLHGG